MKNLRVAVNCVPYYTNAPATILILFVSVITGFQQSQNFRKFQETGFQILFF